MINVETLLLVTTIDRLTQNSLMSCCGNVPTAACFHKTGLIAVSFSPEWTHTFEKNDDGVIQTSYLWCQLTDLCQLCRNQIPFFIFQKNVTFICLGHKFNRPRCRSSSVGKKTCNNARKAKSASVASRLS